jgi:hypothetical protein
MREPGDDEKIDLLEETLEVTLTQHHRAIRKLPSSDAVVALREVYGTYHNLYAERRENWDPVPAERLAVKIYNSFKSKERIRCALCRRKSFTPFFPKVVV